MELPHAYLSVWKEVACPNDPNINLIELWHATGYPGLGVRVAHMSPGYSRHPNLLWLQAFSLNTGEFTCSSSSRPKWSVSASAIPTCPLLRLSPDNSFKSPSNDSPQKPKSNRSVVVDSATKPLTTNSTGLVRAPLPVLHTSASSFQRLHQSHPQRESLT